MNIIEVTNPSFPINAKTKDQAFFDPTTETNPFEFWPAWTIHLPMYVLGIYWGFRLQNLNYFQALNPAIENGGLFNYSKFDSMLDLAEENIPKSILSNPPHDLNGLLEKALKNGIHFPLILKPNIGERGRGVRKITNQTDVGHYLEAFENESLILQEFISKKEEYGIFIVKNPETGQLSIPSITQKIPLQVIGNGVDSVRMLAENHPRVRRYLHEIQKELLEIIPAKNEIFQLSHSGNHCRGALFLDRSELISPKTLLAFEQICRPLSGFYYGRFDVKVESSADLEDAFAISILEVNGANAEPIHIYSPGNSYVASLKIIATFFREMAKIAKFNLKSMPTKPGLSTLKHSFQSYKRLTRDTNE
ncbi:ATP-grasp domain-containing protein [Algoriphagus sp. AGSA1]|uniref:ATP-grasp domain-containing protein n=1 Tax=Algoriphagus sp. AGSA1 TaxID=2907213 RepID=UPI001F19DA05|nr:ATP-grasp domain-containing protein [Algoriphagus sp. AGSA1]MCE7057136.1 ATP-grasp domain-containing protein [Algoriphagus sp. AGSA1]